jgi:titin
VALGNGFWGIGIQEAADNSVGGPAAGAGNVISGNDEGGVAILGVHAVGDVVQGNVIGTNAAESAALGNGESGVYVGDWGVSGDAASDALIGGTAAGDGNVISSNGNWGVWISDTGTTGVVVEGNAIGTNAKGTAALGNAYSGVYINGGAENNTIGGTATGAGNVLSDNTDHGVDIAGSSHNVVQGNLIGTNGAGTAALGNLKSGVFLEQGADDNLIGGTATGAGNLLSGNDLRGIHITGGSSGNLVEGNSIGTNTADNAALGNLDSGVLIDGSSYKNTIGGTANGPGNTIAGNQGDGIDITDSAYSNLVEGNLIGTNTGGATNLGNKLDGVLIDDGSYSNTVGGSAAGAGNTISNNAENGVAISGAGTGNQIAYDAINSNANDGVYLDDTPSTSVIDCTINSNVGWGIWEESSSGYNFTGTVLKNNGHGNKIYYG